MTGMLMVLAVVVVVIVAYVVGRISASTPAPESKRFGLEQAEAVLGEARGAVGDLIAGGVLVESTRRTVEKSVVRVQVGTVSALGYTVTVADDVAEKVNSITAVNARRDAMAEADEVKISALCAEIARLRATNADAGLRAAELREIAEIFRG